MKLLDQKTERDAVGVVKQAIAIVNDDPSTSPNQALIKAAEGQDFTPQMLGRLVEAYNSSASVAHMENSDVEKRSEIIPLADAGTVAEHFFPKEALSQTEKTARYEAPHSYNEDEKASFMPVPAPMEKSASTKLLESLPKPRKYEISKDALWSTIQKKKKSAYKKAEVFRTDARHSLHYIAKLAEDLGEYFRKIGSVSFQEVEDRAISHFGEDVQHFLKHVFEERTLDKVGHVRGSVTGRAAIVDETAMPYSIIKQAMIHRMAYAHNMNKLAEAIHKADDEHKRHMDSYDEYIKQAEGGAGAIISALGPSFQAGTTGFGGAFKPEAAAPVLTGDVVDPEHEASLAGIRQKALLDEMMANDPVIAAVEPATVVRAFNELSAMAPYVARQPALLKSLLRRKVQQEDVDPFEVKQIIDMDSALQKREEPTTQKVLLHGGSGGTAGAGAGG